MADLQTVLAALRNADAVGDTEAAARLAEIASTLSGARAQTEDLGGARDYGFGEAFTKGVSRGASRLGSTVTDIIPALAGAGLGFDEYAREQLAEAAAKEEELQLYNPAQFQSYKDVGGVGDAVSFALETLGEQVPNLGAMLIPGLGGGALATRGLTTAAPAFAGRMAAGQLAGAGLGSYALNAPEVFQNIYEETGQIEPGAALIAGSVAAALDSILPAQIAKGMTGPLKAGVVEALLKRSGMDRGMARKAVAGVIGGAATEGVTEAAQEAISITAERFVNENPELFGEREISRIVESAVRGAVAGGGFSGASGAVEGVREKSQIADRAANIQRLRDERLEQEAAAAAPEIEPEVAPEVAPEVEEVVPEPTVRGRAAVAPQAEEVAPEVTPAAPDLGGILRDMGYTEEQIADLTPDQARAIIEEADPEALDQLDAAPVEQARTTTPQEELQALKATLAEVEAEGAASVEPPSSVLPTDRAGLSALLPGANKGLAIFREDGILAGRDLADPAVATQVKEALEAAAQRFSGKNATAVEEFLKRPEFQVKPPEPAPTTVAAEEQVDELTGQAPQMEFSPAVQGQKRGVVRRIKVPEEDIALAEELAAQEAPVVTKDTPLSPEQAAAMFFRAFDPASALRVMVAEGMPSYTETETVPTKEDARNAVRWVRSRMSEAAKAAVDRHAKDFSTQLSKAKVTAKKRDTRSEIDEAFASVDKATSTTAKVDAAIRKTKGPSEPIPKGVDKETAAYLRKLGKEAEAKVATLEGANILEPQATVAAAARPEEKVEEERKLGSQKRMFELTGGKVTELPYSGPENVKWGKYFLRTPKFRGADLNSETRTAVESGNLTTAIDQLIAANNKNPSLQKFLRKVKALNPKTKVAVGATEEGSSGSYDPTTDTITLDPETGMNEHTLVHELTHAALAREIENPNSPLTQRLNELFSAALPHIDGEYGATNLQEFAAELRSNPEFGALLKDIKAPKGGSVWQQLVQAVAEFFGFRKGESLYDAGIKLLDEMLDISQGLSPENTQVLYMGTPRESLKALEGLTRAATAAPKATLRDAQEMVDRATKDGGAAHKVFGFLNLQNIVDVFKNGDAAAKAFANDVKGIHKLALQRLGFVEKESARISEERAKFPRTDDNPVLMGKTHDIAFDARAAGIDLRPGVTQKLTKAQEAEKQALTNRLNALPKKYKDMYFTQLADYEKVRTMQVDAIKEMFKDDPTLMENMLQRFRTEVQIPGYIPSSRFGDIHVYFTDEAGVGHMEAFETIAARDQFLKDAKLKPAASTSAELKPGEYLEKRSDESLFAKMGNRVPPSPFVGRLMDELRARGATDSMLGAVHELYLSTFPASSMAKRAIKSRNVPGMSKDMPRVHADFMLKAIRQIADLKYSPQINDLLNNADKLATSGTVDPTLRAAARNVAEQRQFLNNPTYSNLVNALSTGSYWLNIVGNISSALVNVSSIGILTYPLLAARFGSGVSLDQVVKAGGIAGGKNWGVGKYKALYDYMNEHGQLKHTMHRELVEASRTKSGDSETLFAKLTDLLSVPFRVTEEYNRATTAIAAYELAKGKKDIFGKRMSEQEALEFALETVVKVNTSGTAAVSPRYMQTSFGRVWLTFKSFNLNGSFVAARGLYEALKGESPEVRRLALRQTVGIYAAAGAVGGVAGLPFMGMAGTMVNALAALFNGIDDDDDDFFSFDMMMRENLGRFLTHGPLDFITGTAISSRAVLTNDLLFRADPETVASQGYVTAAMKQAFGPVGGFLINFEEGIKLAGEGKYARGAEQMLPSFMRNITKTFRFMVEDGVRTRNGDLITDDVNAYNLFMQSIGFSPSKVSDLYERRSAVKEFEANVQQKRARLLDAAYAARKVGDTETFNKAVSRLNALGRQYPGLVAKDTLNRSMRARDASAERSITGLRISNWARPEAQRLLED